MSLQERKAELSKLTSEQLVQLIVNQEYNDFVGGLADYEKDDEPIDKSLPNGFEHGKRIPYIGWYWRRTDWYGGQVSIGDCGDFIGVMEKNKWDYPGRRLTAEEFEKVIAIVDQAKRYASQGGVVDEIQKNTRGEIERLWDLFQTFSIPAPTEPHP